jgi:hypothetical protein
LYFLPISYISLLYLLGFSRYIMSYVHVVLFSIIDFVVLSICSYVKKQLHYINKSFICIFIIYNNLYYRTPINWVANKQINTVYVNSLLESSSRGN